MLWFAGFLVLMAGIGLVLSVTYSMKCEICGKPVSRESGAILFLGGLWASVLIAGAFILVSKYA